MFTIPKIVETDSYAKGNENILHAKKERHMLLSGETLGNLSTISSIKPTLYGILYTISNQNTKKLAHVLRCVYTQLHQQRYFRTRHSLTLNDAVSRVSYRTLTKTKTSTIYI